MCAYSVETITAGFDRRSWPMSSLEEADAFARQRSIESIGDPIYPNGFFVVAADGTLHGEYIAGTRNEQLLSA